MARLVLLLTLIGVVYVHGVCVDGDSSPCPPPFPDFSAIFRETLKLIPELKISLENMAPTDCNDSPTAVNWTEFNSLLSDGRPVPLNPVCRQSTVTPTYSTSSPASSRSSISSSVPSDQQSSKGSTLETGSTSTTSASPATGVILPVAGESTGPDGRTIGIAVGVAGGVLVIVTVIVIILAVTRCRKHGKSDMLQRGISTISQAPLVTDDSFQPVTPGTPFPQGPFAEYNNSNSLSKGVIKLRDTTFQESSTDPTLPRMKDLERVALELTVTTTLNDIVSLDETKAGCDNMAAATEDEEQDDAGYAGSEVGQELWENEMNMLFEGAKMESNEDISESAKPPTKDAQQDETGSGRYAETPQYMVPTVNDRSRDLFGSPYATRFSSLKLNLPPPSKPSASHLFETTPTKSIGSPFSIPSSTKPLLSPRNSNSRHPLSQTLSEGQKSTKATKAKGVRFEGVSNEAPPAYSSPAPSFPPPVFPNGNEFLREDQSDVHAEFPVDVNDELPSYSEAVIALDNYEMASNDLQRLKTSSSSPSASSSSSPASKQKQPPPQTKPKSKSSKEGAQNSLDDRSQERLGNTAVIRPLNPPIPASAKEVAKDGAAAEEDRVDSSSANAAGKGSAASTGQSSRHVRALLSQFEAVANNKTD